MKEEPTNEKKPDVTKARFEEAYARYTQAMLTWIQKVQQLDRKAGKAK